MVVRVDQMIEDEIGIALGLLWVAAIHKHLMMTIMTVGVPHAVIVLAVMIIADALRRVTSMRVAIGMGVRLLVVAVQLMNSVLLARAIQMIHTKPAGRLHVATMTLT